MRRLGAYMPASTGNPYGQRALGVYRPAAFPLPTASPRYSFGPIQSGSGLGADSPRRSWFWLGLAALGLIFVGALPLPRRRP